MGKKLEFPTKVAKPVANNIIYQKRVIIDEIKGMRTSGEVTFPDLLDLCLGAIISYAIQVVMTTTDSIIKSDTTDTPPDAEAVRHSLTGYFYDQMSKAFSNALQAFAPDIVAHPGITEIAIMKAEDDLIEEYMASVPADKLEETQANVKQLLEQSRRALLQDIEDKKAKQPDFQFVPATEEEIAAEAAKQAAINDDEEVMEVTAIADCNRTCFDCNRETCLHPEPGVQQQLPVDDTEA